MIIYIVAATEQELAPTKKWCKYNYAQKSINSFQFRNNTIYFQVHGVGILSSTFHLQNIALLKPDLILQMGIAGSFTPDIYITETVVIQKDSLGDFGADDNGNFITAFEIGLVKENETPFKETWLINNSKTPKYFDKYKKTTATTVQKVNGSKKNILQLLEKYPASVESMEGAALHYVCNKQKINYVQLRTISNKVETRNKLNWKINEAIHNLNQEMIGFLNTLT